MTPQLKEKIDNLKTKEEFTHLIGRIKTSSAPIEEREEIIAYMVKKHPIFSSLDKDASAYVQRQMHESFGSEVGEVD